MTVTAGNTRGILLLCAWALAPAVPAALFHPRHPGWAPASLREGEVNLAGAMALGPDVLWVDARPRAQFDRRHIPGALPLNLDEWDPAILEVLAAWEESRPVVVYCDSASCRSSREVAGRLRDEFHLSPVYVLRGGWQEWERRR